MQTPEPQLGLLGSASNRALQTSFRKSTYFAKRSTPTATCKRSRSPEVTSKKNATLAFGRPNHSDDCRDPETLKNSYGSLLWEAGNIPVGGLQAAHEAQIAPKDLGHNGLLVRLQQRAHLRQAEEQGTEVSFVACQTHISSFKRLC